MKLALYRGTQKGWRGMGNVLTRWRLRSPYSHCEIVFEPGDRVEALMPDGSLEINALGLWCASASAADKMPAGRRAGSSGGVRFKRIDVLDGTWDLIDLKRDPHQVAKWFLQNQGAMYDWQGIFGFIAWPFNQNPNRFACHEACASALGFPEPERLDPPLLAAVQRYQQNRP